MTSNSPDFAAVSSRRGFFHKIGALAGAANAGAWQQPSGSTPGLKPITPGPLAYAPMPATAPTARMPGGKIIGAEFADAYLPKAAQHLRRAEGKFAPDPVYEEIFHGVRQSHEDVAGLTCAAF